MMNSGEFLNYRRKFLKSLSLLAGTGLTVTPLALAQQSGELPSRTEYQKLIAANRILANENVVDAFGHVSVRSPDNPQLFVMSRSRSPAVVEFSDLMEFDLSGNAINAEGRRPYGERMIHAAIYDARPDVQSVVHHHAYPVLPFTITDEPLRPVVHAASIIGEQIPLWDIRKNFGETDMLVRTIEMGRNLADTLADNTCLLMRGHGAVVVGTEIERAVLTAVYLQVNADVLLRALALGEPNYLSSEEIKLATQTQFSPLAVPRAWEYYCLRAGIDPV